MQESDGFFCILEEREIHRRQLGLGKCSERLCGSHGNRARMRERESERVRVCVGPSMHICED